MWQKSNNHNSPFILLALLWGYQTGYAAEIGSVVSSTLQNQSSAQLQPQYQVQPQVMEIAVPVITGAIPSGCVNPGDPVQIMGRNFPPQGSAGLALGGNGQHLDATIKSWSTTRIEIVLPLSGLQSGKTYYFGVERPDHSRWLSNISQSLIMCKLPIPTHSSSSTALSRQPMQSSGSRSGFAATSQGNDIPPAASDDVVPPTVLPSPGSAQRFTSSGGSLMSGGLPPPPEAPELVAEIEESGVEPGEILMLSANMDEARILAQQVANYGIRPIRRQQLAGVGLVISTFRLSRDDRISRRLQQIREALPDIWSEANHRYELMADRGTTNLAAQQQIAWRAASGCGKGIRIGMIDAAVEPNHDALQGQSIIKRSFITSGILSASAEHGTSIAIQLTGAPGSHFPGLLPEATLYVAEVFRQEGDGRIQTTTEWVIRALDWLVQQQVNVINMSLGGPRNLLLEKVLERVMSTGISVVAAAGNRGASAPPVYPAAQQGVIAVTAIDQARRIYSQANQGDYIDYSAPGVDVRLARLDGSVVYRSGTSFATPFVTALIANTQQTSKEPDHGLAYLTQQVIDLGVAGKDSVFGWGLVQASSACPSQ
ncbi:S8 family serine peptidase [Sedimenticola selenatireducens]|nr:S8 family serine peptidase [Sedimenticola selenatireducens]